MQIEFDGEHFIPAHDALAVTISRTSNGFMVCYSDDLPGRPVFEVVPTWALAQDLARSALEA